MGFLGSLFGGGRSAHSLPKGILIIDYEHVSDGICYHGTVTLAGSTIMGIWTVDDGKNKKSQDLAMTVETFSNLWTAMSDIPDFKAGLVADPDQQLEFTANHVIGTASGTGKEQKEESYMIPAATASAAFREWLSKLGYTGK